MSLYAIEGDVGGGKSFVAVNGLMPRYFWETRRPIYTNLPCDGDELEFYLAWLARSPIVREQYRQRLHFLQPGEEEAFEPFWAERGWVRPDGTRIPDDSIPRSQSGREKAMQRRGWRAVDREVPWPDKQELDEDYRRAGYRLLKRSLGKRDRIREFWWFTEPNAVIFLDESADIWNALSKDRPASLQSYINHHRHYKDDLYFFMQARDDLDVQVRRKIRTLYYVENMKNQNLFDWWALRGLRWPVQHFRVREFHGRKVLGKGGDFDRFEPLHAWKLWPTARRFKNYRSFSAAATLPGKRLPAEGAQSTDLDTPWQRVRDWLGGAWAPLAVLTFIVVAFGLGLRFMYALAGVNSTDIAHQLTGGKTNTPAQPTPNYVITNITANVTTNAPTLVAPAKDPERLLFAGPEYFKTTRRTVRVGDLLGARRVARILFDGVEFDAQPPACGRQAGGGRRVQGARILVRVWGAQPQKILAPAGDRRSQVVGGRGSVLGEAAGLQRLGQVPQRLVQTDVFIQASHGAAQVVPVPGGAENPTNAAARLGRGPVAPAVSPAVPAALPAATNRMQPVVMAGITVDAPAPEGLDKKAPPQIEVVGDTAVGRFGPHQAEFAANLNSRGALRLRMRDGVQLNPQVLGIFYYDPVSGGMALVSGLKDSGAEIEPGGRVVYRNAFAETKADVAYTYTQSSIEQDVVLREQLPDPAKFDLDFATVRLAVITEFLDAPVPRTLSTRIDLTPWNQLLGAAGPAEGAGRD